LTVFTGSTVHHVLFDGQRAVGVRYRRDAELCTANAAREVLVCAGSLATPKLLMLSGVGPAEQLAQHGIACRVESPGVGQNLQEHPGILINYRLKVATLGHVAHSWWRMAFAGLQYALRRSGPASSPVAHVVGYFKTDAALDRPDIQLHFAPFAYHFETDRVIVARDNRVGVALNVCRPRSRGSVTLTDGDPESPPLIRHELLGSSEDVDALIMAGRFIRGIFAASPLGPMCDVETEPGPGVESDSQWAQFLRASCFPMYHPVGTCRMGQDRGSVVDQQLRVHGTQGLRIIDASVMPTLVAANTNAPVIMIAEKAAEQIRVSAGR
jgi:choline dehydrogenase